MNRLNGIQVIIGILVLCGSVAWGQTDTKTTASVEDAPELAEQQSVPTDSPSRVGMMGGMGAGADIDQPKSTGNRITVPLLGDIFSNSGIGGDTVLVIPTEDISVEAMKVIQEDMTIMGRILYKRIRSGDDYGMASSEYYSALGTLRGYWGGGRTVEGIYLQDYGVVYFLRIKIPLLPPSQTEEKKEEEPVADPMWAATKQELQAQQHTGTYTWQQTKDMRLRMRKSQFAPYDAEKVAELKQSLLKALRHASNIRSLKAEDWITVVVVGNGIRSVKQKIVVNNKPGGYGSEMILTDPFYGQSDSAGQTVLTVRAKKTDVDAVANQEITPEEFEKRVTMFTYATADAARPQATSVSLSAPESLDYHRGDSSNFSPDPFR